MKEQLHRSRQSESARPHIVYRNLTPEALQRHAISRNEGRETVDGVLSVETTPTGRYPAGNGVVENSTAQEMGINFGKINGRVSQEDFDSLLGRAEHALNQGDEYVLDAYVRSGIDKVIPVTFRSPTAWTTLFMHNLLVRREQVDTYGFEIENERSFEIVHAPYVSADIKVGENKTDIAVVTQFNEDGHHKVIVANTRYAGENKKKIFGGLNALLPLEGVLPVHASATADSETGEVTVFAGLSGTGKTTLSNDPERRLLGDDEHGIAFKGLSQGIFNFEGGSYAKTIGLSAEKEPDIYQATRSRGAVLENVGIDENGEPIYKARNEGETVVENMRGAYPIEFIPYADPSGVGQVPNRLVLLNAELGVLPPISKLTKEETLHELYKGFTMKMPGTEKGVTEPTPTYSAFFGHVFLTLDEKVYGDLFEEYLDTVDVEGYAIGTGFVGGDPSRRRDIAPTRALIDAINSGAASEISWRRNHLGRFVPAEPLPGVPDDFLDPRNGWEPEAYDIATQKLVNADKEHMERYRGKVRDDILSAGLVLRNDE